MQDLQCHMPNRTAHVDSLEVWKVDGDHDLVLVSSLSHVRGLVGRVTQTAFDNLHPYYG